MYDLRPALHISGDYTAYPDSASVSAQLADLVRRGVSVKDGRFVLAIECYPGVDIEQVERQLVDPLAPSLVIDADNYSWEPERVQARIADTITDDRVFGVMSHYTVADFFDADRLEDARRLIESQTGLVVIVGVGAANLAPADALAYAEVTRWEIQLRWRRGVCNWKTDNACEDQLRKVKRGYFFEWRMADRQKRRLMDHIDLMIDANGSDTFAAVSGDAWRAGLHQFASRPFRLVPYFDTSVWGGHWMQEHFDLDKDAPNFGWAFDGVPEENSVIMDFQGTQIEVPATDVVFAYPRELLGPQVYARFGAEFPIRFDFLDTWGGGNLSLQVHPLAGYAFDAFGIPYTQNESYYILDASPDSHVYLGMKTGVTKEELVDALGRAQETGEFDAERYINKIPVSKHDHVSIPAGTLHCSGADTVVLEISATPYIFTFKLWDWGRLGLDGKPRPINIERGAHNIVADRDTRFCLEELVHRAGKDEAADAGTEGYQGVKTGLHELEFIETRRWWIAHEQALETNGSVHMLNLVEGEEALVVPADGSEPLQIHYGETFIVPESVGSYRIRVHGEAPVAVMQANVRVGR